MILDAKPGHTAALGSFDRAHSLVPAQSHASRFEVAQEVGDKVMDLESETSDFQSPGDLTLCHRLTVSGMAPAQLAGVESSDQ